VVHGVDPVRDPARAPQVLAFDPAGGLIGLFLPALIDRPDDQAAAPSPPRRLLQSPRPRAGVLLKRGQANAADERSEPNCQQQDANSNL